MRLLRRNFRVCILTIVFGFYFATNPINVAAQDQPSKILIENCLPEINALCTTVKPGDGRTTACLYSQIDKISRICYLALFAVSPRLERAMKSFRKAEFECRSSINAHCSNIEAGGGRILSCLIKNRKKLASESCTKLVNALK